MIQKFESFLQFGGFRNDFVKGLMCFLLYSKKESEQRQNELLEGISPALLQLAETNGEELLFDKGGCQLVLAALLKCAGIEILK